MLQPPFAESDPPSYNEIMRLNSPEFCDETEQMEVTKLEFVGVGGLFQFIILQGGLNHYLSLIIKNSL